MSKDLLMWVGEKYYPRIQDFIEEADLKGVCKRIGTVPALTPGVSRCFLLHRDGAVKPRCFGWFIIADIMAMITGAAVTPLLEKYGNKVKYASRSHFPHGERGCGEMAPGGLYIVSGKVFNSAKSLCRGLNPFSDLHTFPYPYPKLAANFSHFRGYRYIDGDAFMEDMLSRKWG